jgi:dihydropteroate synthase
MPDSDHHNTPAQRILFVTGRLAEFSLREVVNELGPREGFEPVVVVLPISVIALAPMHWIARKLTLPPGVSRIILPGLCRGEIRILEEQFQGVRIERGPEDLRQLPRYFGRDADRRSGYGAYDIEILAEINHVPRLSRAELLACAERYRAQGADVIDLGCDPDGPWPGLTDAVRALRDAGHRVSIDSFDEQEVAAATAAGAELVLSVNGMNVHQARDWGAEVVAIPDVAGSLQGLEDTLETLDRDGVKFRIDPILEPVGLGFAASLGRYLEVRSRWPHARVMMGVGNVTELLDADSSAVNTLLAGFCQEAGITSVLTTAVVHWARDAVRELDLARRLVAHAARKHLLPKHLEPQLHLLRDPEPPTTYGRDQLRELQNRIRDHNWRLFAESGKLFAINHAVFLEHEDPFELFAQMRVMDPSHAFYLGYELAKAHTALTLGKQYRQDQALNWGFLTRPEVPRHLDPGSEKRARDTAP